MLIAVAMATLLRWAPDDGPAELVARLGSPRFAEREAAAESLRRLGQPALPALRKARSSQDLEIRGRASKLHDEIESLSLLQPTLVRLDFHDRPLSEVIEEIGRRAGISVTPGNAPSMPRRPQDRPSWPDRRITLEAPDPLPFWEAIDRLCRAGGLRRPYPPHLHGPEDRFGRLVLEPGQASPPRTDVGPFRVELLRICRERDLDLTPGLAPFIHRQMVISAGGPGSGAEAKEIRSSSFFAELLISAEPKLRILGESSLERLKAVDGQGHSVLRESSAEARQAQLELFRINPQIDPMLHPELRFGAGSRISAPAQFRAILLADSTPPGTRLAELKGVIAVAVMARQADPLVTPLVDVKDKTIENDQVRLTIHEAVVKPNVFHGELELTLETARAGETIKVQGPGIGPIEINRPADCIQHELEILDNQGQSIGWSFLQAPAQRDRGRMRLMVRPRNQGEGLDFAKLKFRVYTMVGAAIELPFSFTDVPMP
jgi:hypothetical protein